MGYGRKEGEDDKSSPFFYVGSEAPVHFQPKTPKGTTNKRGKGGIY